MFIIHLIVHNDTTFERLRPQVLYNVVLLVGGSCFFWDWDDDKMVVLLVGICVVGETEQESSSCPVHETDFCPTLGGILA